MPFPYQSERATNEQPTNRKSSDRNERAEISLSAKAFGHGRGDSIMSKAHFVFAVLILIPAFAVAQNGVVQINQSTVTTTGLNRAANGFPFTITQPGSYQLIGNLTVPAGASGIVIGA